MSWQLFDRIRAFARSAGVYQQERLFQDQSNLDRVVSSGEFLDFNQQQALLDQTNLQINRLERYKDYDQMDETGEVSLALDLYADESCLSWDTRIPLLDGTYPTVMELAAKGPDFMFWVFAFDKNTGKYVPALASNARITGQNRQMIRIVFDDGESIRITKDHLMMLRDGSFAEAGDLKPGDSLKPLYKKRSYRAKGSKRVFDAPPYPTACAYDFIYDGQHFTSVHKFVYDSIIKKSGYQVIHHKDYNGLNNTPDNLDGISIEEHNNIHIRIGALNPSFNDITLEQIEEFLKDHRGPLTRKMVRKVCGIGFRVLVRVLAENNTTWGDFKKKFHRCECVASIDISKRICDNCKRISVHDYHQEKKSDPAYRLRRLLNKRHDYRKNEAVTHRVCEACEIDKSISEYPRNKTSYSKYCSDCRPSVVGKRYLKKSFANHKIAKIEDAGVEEFVYDISVPGYNCFAAGTDKSWVIVHNCLSDPEYKHTVIIKSKTRVVKKAIEELLFDQLLIDNYIRPMVRYLCKYGDAPFEIVPNSNRDGVSALKFMNIYNFTRVETKFGDLVGFFYQDETQQEPVFLHPWQVMHLRLTSYENIYHPYGRGILEGGRKAFKQLRLMEDAALIYRITRAPEKRIFKIPVGQIPTKEVPQYIQAIARQFKKSRFYDPRTGAFNERYSPLIQEDDFFLPFRPDGQGPSIEKFPGAENLDAIADIEYFKKKMIAPLKIPFSRVGIGDGAGENNEKSLSSSHSEFSKAVQWVQREVVVGLTKVVICHLAMKGFTVDQIKNFQISMSATSAIEELYRMETWGSRVGVMADLKDLGWFPKAWIVRRFTDLSPDEIQELDELQAKLSDKMDEEEGGGGGGGMGGLPDLGGGDMDMGDMGGEEGLPDLGEEGGEEGGLPDLGGGDEGGDEGGDLPPLESKSLYNKGLEKKVLIEAALSERKHLILDFLKSVDKNSNPRSSLEFMIESNELVGLGVDTKEHKFKKSKISFEPSASDKVINEAKAEYKVILMGGETTPGESAVITDKDIPKN